MALETEQPASEYDKQKYSDEASQALEGFLSSGDQLELSYSDAPKVSIILVLYNQAPLTYLCL